MKILSEKTKTFFHFVKCSDLRGLLRGTLYPNMLLYHEELFIFKDEAHNLKIKGVFGKSCVRVGNQNI